MAGYLPIRAGDDLPLKSNLKQRRNGRVVGTRLRVIYGDRDEVLSLLGQSTAYVERSNLTSRTFNSRLVRKTLAFSKDVGMYEAHRVYGKMWSTIWDALTSR